MQNSLKFYSEMKQHYNFQKKKFSSPALVGLLDLTFVEN
jgi:hypothetical protein